MSTFPLVTESRIGHHYLITDYVLKVDEATEVKVTQGGGGYSLISHGLIRGR